MDDGVESTTVPLIGGKIKRKGLVISILIGVSAVAAIIILALSITVARHKPKSSDNNNSNNNNQYDQCPITSFPLSYDPFYQSTSFPSQKKTNVNQNFGAGVPVMIRNGTIWTGKGDTLVGYDLIFQNGLISAIGYKLTPPSNANIINAQLAYITPGLVDMHSHLGVYAFPEDAFGTQDGNEMSDPTTPYVRAIDGLNANDPAIPLIRSGGVTTSLVLPGSGNVMGGEAAFVKLKGVTVANMLIPEVPRAFKMACGENPKRIYGNRNQMPYSRMGNAFKGREQFFKAVQLLQQQNMWDCQNASTTGGLSTPRPVDLRLEPLIAIMKGAVLNVHCYKVEDMEMMIRTANEFGFKISTFHHAIEAWKIPEILKENNITVATFSDIWGYKMEAYDSSVRAGKILSEAGVNFAYKSDHPVIFAKYLLTEAAQGHYYGMSELKALQSVTVAPATAIRMIDRVGTIEVGKHADVVVWDRYPLAVGAQANFVYIEGKLYDSFDLPVIPKVAPIKSTVTYSGANTCVSSNSYAIQGVRIYGLVGGDTTYVDNGVIVVTDGNITCSGTSATCTIPPNTATYSYSAGAVAVPGLVNTGAPIGQVEIDSEGRTQDGDVDGNDNSLIQAVDGIRFSNYKGRHIPEAFVGGVLTTVNSPLGSSLITGTGVAFHTISDADLLAGKIVDDVLINQQTSLHIVIGNSGKSSSVESISGQISALRKLFNAKVDSNGTSPIELALAKTIPVVAKVNQVDQIAAVLRLKKEFDFDLVILGGAEAHIIAPKLAAQNVKVILAPYLVTPSSFETWRASEDAPLILSQNGVEYAIAITDQAVVRSLRWYAGHSIRQGLSWVEALKSVTYNPAKFYGIDQLGVGTITVGTPANFIVFDSYDALSYDSNVDIVALGNTVTCKPQAF